MVFPMRDQSTLPRKLLAAKRVNILTDTRPQADTSAWEKDIEEKVYELYGLTEEEVKIVEGR